MIHGGKSPMFPRWDAFGAFLAEILFPRNNRRYYPLISSTKSDTLRRKVAEYGWRTRRRNLEWYMETIWFHISIAVAAGLSLYFFAIEYLWLLSRTSCTPRKTLPCFLSLSANILSSMLSSFYVWQSDK